MTLHDLGRGGRSEPDETPADAQPLRGAGGVRHIGATAADDADGTDDDTGTPTRAPEGWASITACPNGPLLVRGDVEILLAGGRPAPRRRATVALCRCGASGIKPYCDGSHKAIGFRTDDEPT